MMLASIRACAFHFPAAAFTHGDVRIAVEVGAVDHPVARLVTYVASRNYGWVYLIYICHYPVVKNVALAFEVFTSLFNSIFDYSSMLLIYIFESLFQQICTGFFALDASSAVGDHLLAFKVFQLIYL